MSHYIYIHINFHLKYIFLMKLFGEISQDVFHKAVYAEQSFDKCGIKLTRSDNRSHSFSSSFPLKLPPVLDRIMDVSLVHYMPTTTARPIIAIGLINLGLISLFIALLR